MYQHGTIKILQKSIQMDMGIHLESSSPGWFREQHKLHIADQCIQRGMSTNRLQKCINMAPSKILQKSIQVAHCRSVHTKRYEYKQTAEMYQHGTIKNIAKIYTGCTLQISAYKEQKQLSPDWVTRLEGNTVNCEDVTIGTCG